MNPAEMKIVELGHSVDGRLPLKERVELYRAIGATTSSTALAAHFYECADDLAAADAKVGQLVLNLGKS